VRQNRFNALSLPVAFVLLGFLFVQPAFAEVEEDEDRGTKRWQEKAVDLPAAPLPENLLPLYVSAATDNDFFVDVVSLTVGPDGVVRYVLVIQSAGGARNVSFEGLRCETRERRVYALGRLDGTWSRSRNESWQRIRDVPQIAITLHFFMITSVPAASLFWVSMRLVMHCGGVGTRKAIDGKTCQLNSLFLNSTAHCAPFSLRRGVSALPPERGFPRRG